MCSVPEESVENKRNKLGNTRKDRFFPAKNLNNPRPLLHARCPPSPPLRALGRWLLMRYR